MNVHFALVASDFFENIYGKKRRTVATRYRGVLVVYFKYLDNSPPTPYIAEGVKKRHYEIRLTVIKASPSSKRHLYYSHTVYRAP